ncbi:MAG: hypothetical protein CR982_09845 [Candidatus Cloacimonadota bacterium]|nr:MAG: hypothetical protein CR982_09845 [Candidatus Cloacimonadota bacterium]PIE78208.1 MAG: hypothetical protein CSA15_09160 [Candidatus Delongbacteria bacterium]
MAQEVGEIGKIRKRYSRISDLLTIGVLLAFTAIFTFHHKFKEVEIIEAPETMAEIEIEQVDVTIQKVETVAPKKVSVPVAVEDDEEFDEDVEIEFEDSDFSFDDPPPPPPEFIDEVEEEVAIDFFAVQSKPEMVGGMKSLYNNLVYPVMARRAGKNGSVTLKFICSKTGKPTNIKVLSERPKDLGFGKAAVDALKKCVFKPGLQRDKPVPVSMKLPVKFRVQ